MNEGEMPRPGGRGDELNWHGWPSGDSRRQTDDLRPGQAICEALEDTGERMLPEKTIPITFWEHIYRYRFATRFVRSRRVLDIACGEGYGTAALAKAGAASVIGVDISETTCQHARRKYGIDARPGSADSIPLADRSMDVIVSFETIEHVPEPEAFLDECRRVLVPAGLLVISTPNRDAFREAGPPNPFHCSEMDEGEFVSLLAAHFARCQLYTQRPKSPAWWSTRSLAAEISPWPEAKWYRRVQERLLPLCSHVQGEVEEAFRQSPAELILAGDRRFATLVNPHAVQKRSPFGGDDPYYFVAVARSPRSRVRV